MPQRRLTRRNVLRKAVSASAGAVAFPYIVPSSALGLAGTVAPSNRIVMGAIGLGGQGSHILRAHLNVPEVQMVAVCDVETSSTLYYGGGLCGREQAGRIVDEFYSKQSASGSYKACSAYQDFREVVARKDIDAVTVTTPDHWHAIISVAAANAGKDIYCEKPLANSVAEGRAICDAVRRNKRVLQTGSHERSGANARYACELVRNGRIGRLKTIHINLPCSDPHHKQILEMNQQPQPEMPVPEGLDYDFWLGPAPKVPYTRNRCHFWWRFILNYGGGEMTDRGAHVIDLAQLGNGTDDSGPVEFMAEGRNSKSGLYDAFMEYRFENVYANGVRMIGETREPRGLKFEGEEGWIFVHVHGAELEASRPSILKETIRDGEVQLGRSPGHQRNFIDSVISRKDPVAPAEAGHRTASICHLNNIAMKIGKPFRWDPKAEKADLPEVNALLAPKMRGPWKL